MSLNSKITELREKAGSLATSANGAFKAVQDSYEQGGLIAAFSTVADGAKQGWSAAQHSYWKNRIGEEDAVKVKEILEVAEPLFAALKEKAAYMQNNPGEYQVPTKDFFAELEKRKQRPIDSPFAERRGARNCRLAAAAIIKKYEGCDFTPYMEVRDLATKVEKLYKALPQSYVDQIAAWNAAKDSAKAEAGQIGDRALDLSLQGVQAGIETSKNLWNKLRPS